jgi:type IV secretion system protein VirD4
MRDDRLDQEHAVTDVLVTTGLAVGGGSGGLVWGTGQLAGLLFGQDWLHVGLSDLPGIVLSLPHHLADPQLAWPAVAQAQLPGPVGMYTSAAITFAALIGAGAGALRVKEALGEGAGPRGRDRRHRASRDGAKWAGSWELRRLLLRHPRIGRITLGRRGRLGPLVAAEDHYSVIVFGPPGSHKTTALVVPVLLDWTGPVVTTSIKQDVLRATIEHRINRGDVLVLDPLGLSGMVSARWSPLAGCATWRGAQATAAMMATTDAKAGRGDAEHDFWLGHGEKALAPMLFAAASASHSMRDLIRWVDLREDGIEEVAKLLDDLGAEPAGNAWRAVMSHTDRTLDGIYATVENLLKVYADDRVADFTMGHDLDLGRFLSGDHTLYLYAPPHEQQRLRPLFEVVCAQVVQAAQEQAATRENGLLDPPLLLALDEAANVAALADLPEVVTTGRGQGIQLLTVWHDWAQLKHRYGERASTVLNGHRAKLFLPGLADAELLKLGADLIGDRAWTETTWARDPDGRRSTSQSTTSYRALMPVDELRRLRTGSGILLYGNRRPAKLRLRPHFTRTEQHRRQRTDQRLSVREARQARWETALAAVRNRDAGVLLAHRDGRAARPQLEREPGREVGR